LEIKNVIEIKNKTHRGTSSDNEYPTDWKLSFKAQIDPKMFQGPTMENGAQVSHTTHSFFDQLTEIFIHEQSLSLKLKLTVALTLK
jgi:hypothetical protein